MPGVAALYPSLTVPGFRRLLLGMLPSLLAFQMGVVATGFAAVTLSDSALAVGIVGGAWGLPVLLLPIAGGVAADRFQRRRILLLTHAVIGVAWVVIGSLALADVLGIAHLVVLGLVQGIAFSFMAPARVAFTASILGRGLLPNAVAAYYASMNVTAAVGPIIAGFMLSVPSLGLGWTCMAAAALYFLVLAILAGLPDEDRVGRDRRESALAQLRGGLTYVRSTPPIPRLIGLAAVVTVLGMPYLQLMPVFADRVFGAGSTGLGLLLAAGGLGAFAGSVVTARIRHRRLVWWQRLLGTGFGLALVAFGLSPTFLVALAASFAAGVASTAFTIVNNSLVMTEADPRFYGRVMSVYQLTFALGPIGAIPMAGIADQIGAPQAVALGGIVVVAATLLAVRPRRVVDVEP